MDNFNEPSREEHFEPGNNIEPGQVVDNFFLALLAGIGSYIGAKTGEVVWNEAKNVISKDE